MNWIHTLQIDRLADFARAHVREISYAMATSFVVVISRSIDGLMSRFVGRWHFLLRTLAWIVLFTVGYSMLATWSEIILRAFRAEESRENRRTRFRARDEAAFERRDAPPDEGAKT